MRIDKYLQEKFNLRSRTYAENLIKKGLVQVNGNKVVKTSFDVNDGDDVQILSDENYASQGAYKLLEAINKFSLNLDGLDCIDVGCSNGGFTDCLLRHDANRVLAVDVADCALPENILADPRVEFLKANARNLVLEEKFDFACSDVSFISLRYILPTLFSALKNGGRAVVLVKPQFELDKSALNKKVSSLPSATEKKQSPQSGAMRRTTDLQSRGSPYRPFSTKTKTSNILCFCENPIDFTGICA